MPYTHREVGDKECVYKKNGPKVGCTTGDIDDYLAALHANVKTENELRESFVSLGREKVTAAISDVVNAIKTNVVNTSDAVQTIVKSIKDGQELTSEQKTKIENDLRTLLKDLVTSAVFMLPFGSLFLITFNLIKKYMEKRKENITESNKIKGGKADNKSSKDIADKFSISVNKVEKQIKKGKKVESEHTKDEDKIEEISMDHLFEFPDYYDRLEKMEKEAKKYWKNKTNENKLIIKKLLRENLI